MDRPVFGTRFWLGVLAPSRWVWLVALLSVPFLAFGVLVVGLSLNDDTVELAAVPFFVALMLLTPLGVSLWAAGLVAGKNVPKALLVGASVLCFGLSFAIAVVSMMASGGVLTAVAVGLLFFGPFLLLSVPPAVGFSLGSVGEVRRARARARRRWLREQLDDPLHLDTCGAHLGLGVAEVEGLVWDHVEEGTRAGRVSQGWWLPSRVVPSLHAQLLAAIDAGGGTRIDALAQQLVLPGQAPGVPEALAKTLLFELVHRGRFSGYVNWDDKTVYSAAAEQLKQRSSCPQCGAKLTLVAGGVVRCTGCGSDVMVAG